MELRFKRLEHGEGLPLPAYATAGAAAMDICSAEDQFLEYNQVYMIKTGFAVAVPEGYELQVRPRSGMASRGVMVVNSPGTVDSDYRGEIKVLLMNTRVKTDTLIYDNGYVINRGDRIAQLVLAPVTQAVPIEVTELDETTRGANGFGSTGRN
jgi:dUTP pyrophosphatase